MKFILAWRVKWQPKIAWSLAFPFSANSSIVPALVKGKPFQVANQMCLLHAPLPWSSNMESSHLLVYFSPSLHPIYFLPKAFQRSNYLHKNLVGVHLPARAQASCLLHVSLISLGSLAQGMTKSIISRVTWWNPSLGSGGVDLCGLEGERGRAGESTSVPRKTGPSRAPGISAFCKLLRDLPKQTKGREFPWSAIQCSSLRMVSCL